MRIPFTDNRVPSLEVADSNLLAVLQPSELEPLMALDKRVEEALEHPIGSPDLEKLASGAGRILILVDDATRQTPAGGVLLPLLRRLGQHVERDKIQILIAAGTHARMTQPEVETKIGAELQTQYAVFQHHWKTEGDLVRIGVTQDGTPIRVNRMLGEADFVIGIGQIVPHRVMGYTGGGTIVQPGVSGPEVTGYTHWFSAQYSAREIIGVANNPVRQEVEEIARRAGLRFIVNVVMDARGQVIHVVAGDVVAAHRRGAELSRGIYAMTQSAPADVVIAESYPADYDLWQAAKGIGMADLSVKEGGVVVLITPCPHGVAEEHPEVEQIGYKTFAEVKVMLDRKEIADRVAAAHLAHVGRVICDRAHGIMVSPGIPAATQRHLGFRPARTPQEALEMGYSIAGANAMVAVLRQGGSVMPVVPA